MVITRLMLAAILGSLIVIIFLAILGIRSMKDRVVSGAEGLIGLTGKVKTKLEPEGIVYVNNEDYTARSKDETVINKGAKVKVLAVDGTKIIVEKTI